jgi:hypothetical protein
VDALSGKSYEHRRQWIVDRIKQLTDIFAIDTCSFAVLQNHYHLILHIDTEGTASRRLSNVGSASFPYPSLSNAIWLMRLFLWQNAIGFLNY